MREETWGGEGNLQARMDHFWDAEAEAWERYDWHLEQVNRLEEYQIQGLATPGG